MDVAGQTVSDPVILTGRSWQMFATAFTVNCQKKYFIRTLFSTLEVPQRLQSERISWFHPLHKATITKRYHNSTADQYHFYNCIIKRIDCMYHCSTVKLGPLQRILQRV